jgi:LmbE family N-acetylglucosaminyl deacetylase
VLVVVAHPDDEAIGMAGVIAAARREGRRVEVAIVADGSSEVRRGESIAGLALLGVPREDIVFLGYPDGALDRLPRLRARRRLRRRLAAVAADEGEIYTHVPFDGHPDHVVVVGVVLAVAPSECAVWGTLMHPPGAGACLELSASRWPGPFRPAGDPEPPPSPACAERPEHTSWGPLGPPHVLVEVPADMQRSDEQTNLKWQAIACHRSQIELSDISARYLRGFVRRREFFWRLAG